MVLGPDLNGVPRRAQARDHIPAIVIRLRHAVEVGGVRRKGMNDRAGYGVAVGFLGDRAGDAALTRPVPLQSKVDALHRAVLRHVPDRGGSLLDDVVVVPGLVFLGRGTDVVGTRGESFQAIGAIVIDLGSRRHVRGVGEFTVVQAKRIGRPRHHRGGAVSLRVQAVHGAGDGPAAGSQANNLGCGSWPCGGIRPALQKVQHPQDPGALKVVQILSCGRRHSMKQDTAEYD